VGKVFDVIKADPERLRDGDGIGPVRTNRTQRQLRHKSFTTTAGGYIREGRLFKESSASFALR
jgi:hypothetical protein